MMARVRRIAAAALMVTIGIGIALSAIEIGLRCCYADSAGKLTSLNWIMRHWSLNSAGFRDQEWHPDEWQDKTTVVITGDSFAAGWGIDDPDQRFGDQLARRLGSDYAVANIAISGTSTRQQAQTLAAFNAFTPDIVLMQYFLNDIDDALLSLGLPLPEASVPPLTRQLYLADFIHTRVNSDGGSYWRLHYAAYDNYVVWEQHVRAIDAYIDQVEALGARLIMVIFPNMLDPVGSIPYVDRVAQVFTDRGYNDILKLFDDAEAWAPRDRVMSVRDGHPSAAFHALVGERLHRLFFS